MNKQKIAELGIRNAICHFRHITNNILSVMVNITNDIKGGTSSWEDGRKDYLTRYSALRKYWRLIDKFPKFREGETFIERDIEKLPKPYFPKVSSSDPTNYVNHAYSVFLGKKS